MIYRVCGLSRIGGLSWITTDECSWIIIDIIRALVNRGLLRISGLSSISGLPWIIMEQWTIVDYDGLPGYHGFVDYRG